MVIRFQNNGLSYYWLYKRCFLLVQPLQIQRAVSDGFTDVAFAGVAEVDKAVFGLEHGGVLKGVALHAVKGFDLAGGAPGGAFVVGDF